MKAILALVLRLMSLLADCSSTERVRGNDSQIIGHRMDVGPADGCAAGASFAEDAELVAFWVGQHDPR